MKCYKCGTVLPEGSEFCNHCGAPLEREAIRLYQKNLSKSKTALAIAVLALIVAIAALAISLNAGGSVKTAPKATTPATTAATTTEATQAKAKLVAKNKCFNAEYLGAQSIDGVDGAFMINLRIENVSDVSQTYILDDVYIDDTKANFSGSAVPQSCLPGKKLNGTFMISYPEKIENAKKIEFKIVCMNDDFEKIGNTTTITINQ